MGEQKRIVVWDPVGEFWEGSLVERAHWGALESRGAVLLPATPELFHVSGVGAFHRRAWGSGWPMDYSGPRSFAPLTVFARPDLVVAHWAARLRPDPALVGRFLEGEVPQGQLQLVADTSFGNAWRAQITNEQPIPTGARLGPMDADGGWTVVGAALASFPQEGYYGLSLYGMMPGVRLEWAAVSLVAE